jgi:hypothetical protein
MTRTIIRRDEVLSPVARALLLAMQRGHLALS